MSTLRVTPLSTPHPDALPVEVVERKGKGHPDTICDALAEELSITLAQFYQRHFGRFLHHNVDKALLWAGSARPQFGGGTVVAPMTVFIAGRATEKHEGVHVPIEEIADELVRAWLADNLHALDPIEHVEPHVLVRPASPDLNALFERRAGQSTPDAPDVWLANDTSCGVGFAPASELERLVMEVERELTSRRVIDRNPAIGEDVKVMAIRRDDEIDLTIGCAVIGRFTPDIDAYIGTKAEIEELALHAARRKTARHVRVSANAADDVASKEVYLTVTGTSAEGGDDGQAGRGNRVGGLITPCRPMVMESVAGKNPFTHVGKLYNVLARSIAERLVTDVDPVAAANCLLVSRIGRPVGEPALVEVQVDLDGDRDVDTLRPRIEEVVGTELAGAGEVWKAVLERNIQLF